MAVIETMCQTTLNKLRQNLPTIKTDKDKLIFAFEVWSVRPFEMMQACPDTQDLLESTYKYADHITSDAFAELENIAGEYFRTGGHISVKTLCQTIRAYYG